MCATSKTPRFINRPWVLGIGTTVLGGVATSFIYDSLKQLPLSTTAKNVYIWIKSGINSFLNFDIKLWWILVGIVIIILIASIPSKKPQTKSREPQEPETPDTPLTLPNFYKYTSGVLKRWRWNWRWKKMYDGNYQIDNLTAQCPKCDTPMFEGERLGFLSFRCPRCSFYIMGDEVEFPDDIEALILDNIRRENFN